MRVLLVFLLVACVAPSGARSPSPAARAVVTEVNAIRVLHGLPPLALDLRLARAARLHAEEQARLGRISHVAGDGALLEARLERAGYAPRAAGENVASGWDHPADVARSWWESADHRANLLRPQTSEVGVGVATNAAGRTYWTLIVAAPDRPDQSDQEV